MFNALLPALFTLLLTLSCAPRVAQSHAAQRPLSSPVFELETRRSSYGLSLRDPSDLDARLAKRFERACQETGGSFYAGMDALPVSLALREWRGAAPTQRMVILSLAGYTRDSEGTIVGRSEDGGTGPWARVSVALQCQLGN